VTVRGHLGCARAGALWIVLFVSVCGHRHRDRRPRRIERREGTALIGLYGLTITAVWWA